MTQHPERPSSTDGLAYTADHEWLRIDGETATIGITQFAADRLGDIVFAELPLPGASVRTGNVMMELESTKSVGEVFAPVDGVVEAVNDTVANDPALINSDPYREGWLVSVRIEGPLHGLLSAEDYHALIAGEGE